MSLLHQTFPGTDAEADATVRSSSRLFRALVTPWPWQSVVEGAAIGVVGIWLAFSLGSHNLLGGLGALIGCAAAGAVVATPGAYTLRHREQAAGHFAASRARGDRSARMHPILTVVGFVVVGALGGAFGGHNPHQSATEREVWAVVGAVAGLIIGLVRVRASHRRHPADS